MGFLIGIKVKIVQGSLKGSKGTIVNVGEGYSREEGEYNLFFVQIGKTIYQLRSSDFEAV